MTRTRLVRVWKSAHTVLAMLSAICVALPSVSSAQRPVIPLDSLRADSAAFATLPPVERSVLDVRDAITFASADPNVVCVLLSKTSEGSRRQRLQGKLADGTSLVVFARQSASGRLERVEFIRKMTTGEQRGFTWDTAGDLTTANEWKAGETSATTYPVPRGGPVPRALRGLGRIVMQWSCEGG